MLLADNQWRRGQMQLSHTLFALGNAVVICVYTLADGIGTRLSGNSFSYVAWTLVLNGVILAAFVFARRVDALPRQLRARWHIGIGGGLCAWGSYAIALWAMTKTPVAQVAALRETSVIFGTVLAAVVLKEKFGGARYAAAFFVCAGAVSLEVFLTQSKL